MSVVVQGASGWVLDSQSFVDQSYRRCARGSGKHNNNKPPVQRGFKSRCFQTVAAHIVCEKRCAAAGEEGNTVVSKKQGKKRKRKNPALNQGEIDMKEFHEKVRGVVLEGTLSLLDSARAAGFLSGAEEPTEEETVAFPDCGLSALCDMAKQLPLEEEQGPDSAAQALDGGAELDLFCRVTENRSDSALVLTLLGDEYVIPAHASFLLSDFTRIQPLVRLGVKFDLIVLDPPWENKSVKRSRRYSPLPSSQLQKCPVPLLSSRDALIVTWVTNRPSHVRFVREQLYPHWGVRVVALWFWVKVTTSGQFVFPLDSEHKKPYEVIVLGRYSSDDRDPEESSSSVEDHRVIVSVPSTLHSHKPCLSEVLKPYVRPGARCLELFARNLVPGWTSWGNEVLKFQHSSYFTVTSAQDNPDLTPDQD